MITLAGFNSAAWRGHFFKQYKYPRRWAAASDLHVSEEDWRKAWPQLWRQIQADELTVIKRSAAATCWRASDAGGRTRRRSSSSGHSSGIGIVYLNEIGRGSRAWRAWHKAWTLVARDIPTAWPLMVMQKRIFGYITDSRHRF